MHLPLHLMEQSMILPVALISLLSITIAPFAYRSYKAKSDWDAMQKEASSSEDAVTHTRYRIAWLLLAVEKNKLLQRLYLMLATLSILNFLYFSMIAKPVDASLEQVSVVMIIASAYPILFYLTSLKKIKIDRVNLLTTEQELGQGRLTIKKIRHADLTQLTLKDDL